MWHRLQRERERERERGGGGGRERQSESERISKRESGQESVCVCV